MDNVPVGVVSMRMKAQESVNHATFQNVYNVKSKAKKQSAFNVKQSFK